MSAVHPHTLHGPMGGRHGLRRAALGLFFGSVAVNAVLGIYALLAPDFGETDGKILGTSLCVTGALVLAVVCVPAWERGLLGPLPALAALAGAAGFTLAAVSMWAEPEGELLPRLIGTLLAPAGGAALACVLALASLPPRWRRLHTAAYALIAVAATMVVAGFWTEPDSGWYARALGVVLVALAALVVTIPVVHRVGRGEHTAVEPVSFCPFCGGPLAGRAGAEERCPSCAARFVVRSG